MNNAFRLLASNISTWIGTPFAVLITFVAAAISVVGYATGVLNNTLLVLLTLILSYYTQITAQLIQNGANRDRVAMHAKQDALIEVSDAENRFAGLEDATDDELKAACEYLKERRGDSK